MRAAPTLRARLFQPDAGIRLLTEQLFYEVAKLSNLEVGGLIGGALGDRKSR
jgi:hypothetical protein